MVDKRPLSSPNTDVRDPDADQAPAAANIDTSSRTPRALSARESRTASPARTRTDILARDPSKRTTPLDPAVAQHRAAVERAKSDPTAPMPQVGVSSSELNTGHPGVRARANEHAKNMPVNSFPDGEMGVEEAQNADRIKDEQEEATKASRENREQVLSNL